MGKSHMNKCSTCVDFICCVDTVLAFTALWVFNSQDLGLPPTPTHMHLTMGV